MISYLYTQNATSLSALNMIILLLGMISRIYGFTNIQDHIVTIGINMLACLIIYPLYIYINQALMNHNMKQTRLASSLTVEMKTIKNISEEYSDMLQSLEEGIVVIKNNSINFSNDIFKEILQRVTLPSN